MPVLWDAQPGIGQDVFKLWQADGRRCGSSASPPGSRAAGRTGYLLQVPKASSPEQPVLWLLRGAAARPCARPATPRGTACRANSGHASAGGSKTGSTAATSGQAPGTASGGTPSPQTTRRREAA